MFEYEGPVYRQVMDRLKEQIQTGQLKPGDRMPTVRSIATTWKISHATATKVLREMCRDGWAHVQGNGTYVLERGQAEVTIRMPIFGGRRRSKPGLPPSYPGLNEVVEAGIVVAPDYVCDVMEVDRGTEVLRREVVLRVKSDPDGSARPSSADLGRPYCLYVSWHPATFAELIPALLNTGLDDANSPLVYTIVGGVLAEETAGRRPISGLDSMHARTADKRESGHLGIPENSTILARIMTWADANGVTEYMECCYPMGVVISLEHRDPDDRDPDDSDD